MPHPLAVLAEARISPMEGVIFSGCELVWTVAALLLFRACRRSDRVRVWTRSLSTRGVGLLGAASGAAFFAGQGLIGIPFAFSFLLAARNTGIAAVVIGLMTFRWSTAVRSRAAQAFAASPAGWQPDPAGRYQARYWDGGRWTEHVITDGTQTTDPLS